jgi:hypothetical protein
LITTYIYIFFLAALEVDLHIFANTCATQTIGLHQEFKLHGVELQGPCKALQQAGCGGKFTSNVQRDILRKVAKADPKQAMMI